MSIALAALIIALASLMWNVVSTAYSWKFSKPAIRIAEGWRFGNGENWLYIDLYNTGGSSIAVEEIYVFWLFRKGGLYRVPGTLRWRRRIYGSSSSLPEEDGINDPAAGPDLPYTIQPYHAQKWRFDRSELLRSWKNSPMERDKFLVVVTLATGKLVMREIDAWIDEDESFGSDLDQQGE
jgi:hypothetical protein